MRFALLGLSLILSSPLGLVLAKVKPEPINSEAIDSEAIATDSRASFDQPAGFTDPATGEYFAADVPADVPAEVVATSGQNPGQGLVASKCVNYWDGTAPFCKGGPCKPGWHATREDKSGDGKKCWSGHKVYCECDVAPACQDYWSGTAPFCKGSCNSGYRELYQSPVGNGGLCFTGHKSYCQCLSSGGNPPCQPGPIKTTCFGFLLTCNNGCGTPFVCGFCWKSGNKGAVQETDDTLYETLVKDDNTDLRQALSEIGLEVPSDASNEAVVESAVQVIDAQAEQIQTVDAPASFDSWGDVSAWKSVDGNKPIEEPVQIGFAAEQA